MTTPIDSGLNTLPFRADATTRNAKVGSAPDSDQATPGVSADSFPALPSAGQSQIRLDDSFDAMDLDGDGVITRAEYQEYERLKAEFKRLDTNGDGKISLDEFVKGMAGQSASAMAGAATDSSPVSAGGDVPADPPCDGSSSLDQPGDGVSSSDHPGESSSDPSPGIPSIEAPSSDSGNAAPVASGDPGASQDSGATPTVGSTDSSAGPGASGTQGPPGAGGVQGANQVSPTGTVSGTGPTATDGPAGQDPSQYVQTFDSNFTNGVDPKVWNDHSFYEESNPTKNYAVENGRLKIWPEKDASGNFFNRELNTDGKFEQKYGYFEMDAKLPKGKGTWPAFWLYAHPGDRRPELDVMEAYPGGGPEGGWGFNDPNGVARPNAYGATIWQGTADGQNNQMLGTQQVQAGTDLSEGFHKYGLKWEPDKVTFYLDGKEVMSKDVQMNDPMYMITDLWFGSASGQPDDSTPQGADNSLEVKSIKAWQFKDQAQQNQ